MGNYNAIKHSDAHTVAALLKLFFKLLKTSLIPVDTMEFLLEIISLPIPKSDFDFKSDFSGF